MTTCFCCDRRIRPLAEIVRELEQAPREARERAGHDAMAFPPGFEWSGLALAELSDRVERLSLELRCVAGICLSTNHNKE